MTTVAVTAMAEVGPALRFLNVPLGVWIVLSPWLLDGASATGTWSSVISGAVIVALSIPRGAVRERYGAWQRYVV